jgi:NAD(P)-dependent dehydrogenase (short-subunit alcohol dehydrogenase family)
VTDALPLGGRRAFLTGAAGGIGAATARRFCEAGAAVVVTDADAEAARALAARLRAHGHVAHADGLDVTDAAATEQAIADAARRLGGLDVVVANAGILHVAPIERLELASFERTLRVNAVGTFLTLRAAAPLLEPGGVLLCTASQAGLRGAPELTAYCASKFAVVGMVESLARELAPRGIRVAAVAPGLVRTPRLDQLVRERAATRARDAEAVERDLIAGVPAGRAARPEEVADAFVFLASPLASYVSGVALAVDGAELSG